MRGAPASTHITTSSGGRHDLDELDPRIRMADSLKQVTVEEGFLHAELMNGPLAR
jgi:hypothetical protein